MVVYLSKERIIKDGQVGTWRYFGLDRSTKFDHLDDYACHAADEYGDLNAPLAVYSSLSSRGNEWTKITPTEEGDTYKFPLARWESVKN